MTRPSDRQQQQQQQKKKKKKRKEKKRKEKRTCHIVSFAGLADHKLKLKESQKRDEYVDHARELKTNMELEGDGDTNCNWCTWNNLQRICTGTGRLGNKRTNRDHRDYKIIKIGLNI